MNTHTMFSPDYAFDFHVSGLIVEYEAGAIRVIAARTTVFYRHNRIYCFHNNHYCDYAGGKLDPAEIDRFVAWVRTLSPFKIQNWFIASQLGAGSVERYCLNSRLDLHLDSQFFKQCK